MLLSIYISVVSITRSNNRDAPDTTMGSQYEPMGVLPTTTGRGVVLLGCTTDSGVVLFKICPKNNVIECD